MGLYYRADKRAFRAGDVIGPAAEFQGLQTATGRQTTELLDHARPAGIPERLSFLMVFESEECARDYCARMDRFERHLYVIELDEAKIVHRGDMHLVDAIDRHLRKGEVVENALLSDYWEGTRDDDSCIEVLVPSGIVVEELEFGVNEGVDRLKRQIGMSSSEKTSIDDLIFGVTPEEPI